jgi:DNA-directed RNA polymerase subunit RPC12/RpoP
MKNLHHTCPECDSEFNIKYEEENTEDDPSFCPFCCSHIFELEEQEEDE